MFDRRAWTETSDHLDAPVVLTPAMSSGVSRSAVPAAVTPVAVAIDCVDSMSAENIGKVDSGRLSLSRARRTTPVSPPGGRRGVPPGG